MDRNEAIGALGAIGEARAATARAAKCPPWRHAAFGALTFAMIGVMGLETSVGAGLQALVAVAILLLVQSDRKRTGMFVNGWRRGATLPVSIAMFVILTGLVWVQFHAREDGAAPLVRLGIALAAGLAGLTFSIVWQRIYERELGA